MKKALAIGMCALVLLGSIGSVKAYATDNKTVETNRLFGEKRDEMHKRPDGFRKTLTDEEKAQIETEQRQREEKMQAFIDSLNASQKALYDAMTPEKPDASFMASYKENSDAFIASLTETQKAEYEDLSGGWGFHIGTPGGMPGRPDGFRKEMTDEEKAQLETAKAQREEKMNALIQSFNADQKALFDELFGRFYPMFDKSDEK